MESTVCIPLQSMDNPDNPFGVLCLFRNEKVKKWNDYDAVELRNVASISTLKFFRSAFVQPYGFPYIGKCNMAIMFADLRGSTPFTEILTKNRDILYSREDLKNQPVKLSDLLNDFFFRITPAIRSDRKARIDKFTGDGLEALFDNKNKKEEYAPIRAVCAAFQMQKDFDSLKEKWEKDWITNFRRMQSEELNFKLGIGIDYGPVILDVFGSSSNYQYTAVGNHVNFAEQLESMAAKPYANIILENILISEPVHQRVDEFVTCIEHPNVNVIGVGYPQRIYGVVGWKRCGIERCKNKVKCENCDIEEFPKIKSVHLPPD